MYYVNSLIFMIVSLIKCHVQLLNKLHEIKQTSQSGATQLL